MIMLPTNSPSNFSSSVCLSSRRTDYLVLEKNNLLLIFHGLIPSASQNPTCLRHSQQLTVEVNEVLKDLQEFFCLEANATLTGHQAEQSFKQLNK